MLVAAESFTTRYDGEVVRLVAGRDRVGAEHEIARRHPGKFRPVLSAPGRASRSRSAPRDDRPEMPLDEELRIRREWIEEIEARADRRRHRQHEAADPHAAFWRGVERMLGIPTSETAERFRGLNPEVRREQRLFDAALGEMQDADHDRLGRDRRAVESLWHPGAWE
jgi:hypothetical protein